ncbi:MAG: hypothetical protein HUU20_24360 [Pirellulales bacterium]|nr:hypothetical protein [Pirellulales bacterium]
MRKWIWIAGAILGLVVVVIAIGGWMLYRASRQVPEFYRKALVADPAAQAKASNAMLQKTSDLVSDVEREGRWQALFTAEEINGWLAVDLVNNHPGAIPAGVVDPRVAIRPQQLTLACRIDRDDLSGVLSLTVEPYMPEPNVIAVRVRSVRLGALPLPLGQILDSVSDASRQMHLRLQWQQAEGDPVALISTAPPRDQDDRVVRIESLRLGEGEVYISGTTQRR